MFWSCVFVAIVVLGLIGMIVAQVVISSKKNMSFADCYKSLDYWKRCLGAKGSPPPETSHSPIPSSTVSVIHDSVHGTTAQMSVLDFSTGVITPAQQHTVVRMLDNNIRLYDLPIPDTIFNQEPSYDSITVLRGYDRGKVESGYVEWWLSIQSYDKEPIYSNCKEYLKKHREFIFWYDTRNAIFCALHLTFPFVTKLREVWQKRLSAEDKVREFKKLESDSTFFIKPKVLQEDLQAQSTNPGLFAMLLEVNKKMYPDHHTHRDFFIFDWDGHGAGRGTMISHSLNRQNTQRWLKDIIERRDPVSKRPLDLLNSSRNCVEFTPASNSVHCQYFRHILSSSTLRGAVTSQTCTSLEDPLQPPSQSDLSWLTNVRMGTAHFLLHSLDQFAKRYVKTVLGVFLAHGKLGWDPSCTIVENIHYLDGAKLKRIYDSLPPLEQGEFDKWRGEELTDFPERVRVHVYNHFIKDSQNMLTVSWHAPDSLLLVKKWYLNGSPY